MSVVKLNNQPLVRNFTITEIEKKEYNLVELIIPFAIFLRI